jgi:hypothetical protein
MAVPEFPLSPLLRFPNFTELGDLNSLSIVIQDLSIVYEVSAVAVLPVYGQVLMPMTRIGPRRQSLLRIEDRLKVRRVSLASPFELVFGVVTGVPAALAVMKTFLDILAKGTDIAQRRQVLAESRALEPERLREAELRNEILEQRLRRVTGEADLIEQIGSGYLAPPRERRHRTAARQLTAQEFAELLDEPLRRLLSYGGGVLEIIVNEDAPSADNGESESS